MPEKHLFTSESVTEGHPDKICDIISDSMLDAYLAGDPQSRVACETVCTTDLVMLIGEITSKAKVDPERIVRNAVREIGYTIPGCGFDADSLELRVKIDAQSPDIAMGVDRGFAAPDPAKNTKQEEAASCLYCGNAALVGAGDQGLMFGFACDETKELMPLPIMTAHRLSGKLAEVRKTGILPYLRPDGKTQVTVEYDDRGKPARIDTIVVSTQHAPEVSFSEITEDIRREVIFPVLDPSMLDADTKIFVNPTGRFVIGGPTGDSGLTGRKIIVDTYGGYARHGGGAFSGKDATKVDRTASYAARYAAKNLVASGVCTRAEIQLAYAIGVAEPVSVSVNTFGTGKVSEERIVKALREVFDFRPLGMMRMLDLRRPVFAKTASYGHFGREEEGFTWERTDRAKVLAQLLSS